MFEKVILRKLAEVILKRVTKRLTKKFALEDVLKYVKEENEADIQLKQVWKIIGKHGKSQEETQKDVAQLKSTVSMLLNEKSKESF